MGAFPEREEAEDRFGLLALTQIGVGEAEGPRIGVLGEELAAKIEALIPVLPVALLSHVLREKCEQGIPELQLKRDALALAERIQQQAVTVVLDKNDEDRSLSQGLYLLLKRGQVELGGDGRWRATATGKPLLEYYRNAIPDRLLGAFH